MSSIAWIRFHVKREYSFTFSSLSARNAMEVRERCRGGYAAKIRGKLDNGDETYQLTCHLAVPLIKK